MFSITQAYVYSSEGQISDYSIVPYCVQSAVVDSVVGAVGGYLAYR